MKGGAEWAMKEAAHRVRVDLEVQPPDGRPYEASDVTWLPAGQNPVGETVEVRVSRTRPRRVHTSFS
jgi:hypothetical protein